MLSAGQPVSGGDEDAPGDTGRADVYVLFIKTLPSTASEISSTRPLQVK